MMPAGGAPGVGKARRAGWGRCCRSLGHTRNTKGLKPDSSGLDADGEIIAVGVAPPAYTRAAARDVLELKCPTTATTAGSAYNCSATRTAVSSLPESSTTRNSNLRPPMAVNQINAKPGIPGRTFELRVGEESGRQDNAV